MQELSRQAPQHPKKATMKMITPANKEIKNFESLKTDSGNLRFYKKYSVSDPDSVNPDLNRSIC